MKRIPGSKRQSIARCMAAILLGLVSLVPAASADSVESTDSEVVVQSAGGVPYVSGGIGEESIDRLNSRAREFNLKLVFALNSGEYVSDVGVSIANAKGKTLLDATSEGPWFYTRLPAGNYRVVATLNGKTVKRQVAVGSAKLRTVDFRWAAQ